MDISALMSAFDKYADGRRFAMESQVIERNESR